MVLDWQSRTAWSLSGAPGMPLESYPMEALDIVCGRTHNRNRCPWFGASSFQNNVGKGSRQIRFVTLEKELALKVGSLRALRDLLRLDPGPADGWQRLNAELGTGHLGTCLVAHRKMCSRL